MINQVHKLTSANKHECIIDQELLLCPPVTDLHRRPSVFRSVWTQNQGLESQGGR